MFSNGPNYTKLKTNLRLAMARLKLLEKKKAELAEKSRREIAAFIKDGKIERAKIRVEYIIREDYLVEAMEIVEMYCDLLLARFGLVTNMKELDEGISEAVSSLIWVAPRLQSDCNELKVISDLLTAKYGINFADACRVESVETINDRLKHKLAIHSPPKLLVEKYMIEIAKSFNIPYEPDPQIMEMDKAKDALLIDLSDKNNLGGGGMPHPPGFLGYPQPPAIPDFPPVPFEYPGTNTVEGQPTAPPPAFSYNIPPSEENKEFNTDFMDSLPSYNNLYPGMSKAEDNVNNGNLANNLENYNEAPKPLPRTKLDDQKNFDLPELPSVPSDSSKTDDIDFDDLNRRFEALKKK
ncbi:IST1 homolog isoform X1 [Coccinella septempunctata]|uniref:IST1 homolog isoform X1 n=1 Tax=Coccinella septempunctata TaxID=41139 RepID=UPI001D07ED5F|nr:IST1 homolog isoform X1 [Coccinella septempunctata]